MEHYVEDERRADRMSRRAFPLLRAALLSGEAERGRAPELTGIASTWRATSPLSLSR